jgi:hypothetical protein
MREAGLAVVEAAKRSGTWSALDSTAARIRRTADDAALNRRANQWRQPKTGS